MTAARARELPVVEQVVPTATCLACDVCCRFPDADSPLRPYFTADEIQAAVAAGVSPDAFPDPGGSKIRLVPYGEGYLCPAFDPTSGKCGIYPVRPLDCRLYPIAVMWDAEHREVLMGWDSKCPFIDNQTDSVPTDGYVDRMAGYLESEAVAAIFIAHPDLIGSFQEDVLVLRRLERMTAGVQPERAMPPEAVRRPHRTALRFADRAGFEARLRHGYTGSPLAASSFAYHALWQDLFTYEWIGLAGHHGLLAGHAEGSFLALPPLGPDPGGAAMAAAFEVLTRRNRSAAVSRIENVPAGLAESCRAQGYRVVPKSEDYLYRRVDLVALPGDRYKSQRGAYNHCRRHAAPVYRPYQAEDREPCLALFRRWRTGIPEGEISDTAHFARLLAEDAEVAHRTALLHATDLGLLGRVVEVEGRVAAYTFGGPLVEGSVFCIFLEIADREVPGLAQYIFREFCRELTAYELINTLDDAGLAGLRGAKQAYQPSRLVESYIVNLPEGPVAARP